MMAQQSRVPGLGTRPLARDTGETGRAWGAAPPSRPALARSPASAWPSTEHRAPRAAHFLFWGEESVAGALSVTGSRAGRGGQNLQN